MSERNGTGMRFRSQPPEGAGPVFTIEGVTREGEDFAETFHGMAAPTGMMSFRLLAAGASRSASERIAVGVEFIMAVIEPDEEERFSTLVADKRRFVSGETIGQVGKWLIEWYTGRPTLPPSGSPDGRSLTTDTSTEEQPSPASSSTDVPLPG